MRRLGARGLIVLVVSLGAPASAQEMTTAALSDWSFYNTLGWLALQKGDFPTAERRFHSAIGIARRYAAKSPRLLARSYHDLAWTLHEERRFAEAEPLAEWALAVREHYDSPASPALGQNLNTLATIYFAERKFAKAEGLYRRAITVWEQAAGPDDPTTAATYQDLAIVLSRQRKYADAEPVYQHAQALFSRDPPNYPALVDALCGLAENDMIQGRTANAEPLYKRAIEIYDTKHILEEDGVLKQVLQKYAAMLRQAHREKEAEPLEARARGIRIEAR